MDESHQIGCVRLRNREGTCTCKQRPATQVLRSVLEGFEDGDGVIRDVKASDIVDEFHAALSRQPAG